VNLKGQVVNHTIPAGAGRREWIALAVLALPTLLVSIDVYTLLLALPDLWSRNALCASVRKAYYHGYCSGPWQLHPRCCACGGRAGVF
jgi:hypothetical protein